MARTGARRRVRIVQPVPRWAFFGWEHRPDPNTPNAPNRRAGQPAVPTTAPTARAGDGRARLRGVPARTTPEDATLRALFRVAAAAVARREGPKP